MLRVNGFDNRGTGKYPNGYIVFSDRTRITYASLLGPDTSRPGATRDEWGLNPDWEDQGISEVHLRLARAYVDTSLVRPAVAVAKYLEEKAAREAKRAALSAAQ